MSQSIKLIDWRNQDKWPKLYNALFKVVEIYKPYVQKNKKLENCKRGIIFTMIYGNKTYSKNMRNVVSS